MSSKIYKKTVQTVSRNLRSYTEAMDADIQVLITSMLELIESKIGVLRKLLKLKLCIKKVKSIVDVKNLSKLEQSSTVLSDANLTESLDELSSMVYEVDKDSLPADSEGKDNKLNQIGHLSEIEQNALLKNLPKCLDASLDKFIYMVKDKNAKLKAKGESIGDGANDEKVVLAKGEYQSILDILDSLLNAYEKQDQIKVVEKTNTEPAFPASPICELEQRKIASDCVNIQKDIQKKQKLVYVSDCNKVSP